MKTRSFRLNHPIYLLLYIDITRQSVILTSALLRQSTVLGIYWCTQQKPTVVPKVHVRRGPVEVLAHVFPTYSETCDPVTFLIPMACPFIWGGTHELMSVNVLTSVSQMAIFTCCPRAERPLKFQTDASWIYDGFSESTQFLLLDF